MKTYTALLLILVSFKSFSQTENKDGIWIGGSLGLMFTETEIGKGNIEPASFSFSMPVTWRKNNFLIESTPTYCGAFLWHLNGGYSIPVSESVSLDLLAGLNDNIMISTDKFQVVHAFNFNSVARLQWKDFFTDETKNNVYHCSHDFIDLFRFPEVLPHCSN